MTFRLVRERLRDGDKSVQLRRYPIVGLVNVVLLCFHLVLDATVPLPSFFVQRDDFQKRPGVNLMVESIISSWHHSVQVNPGCQSNRKLFNSTIGFDRSVQFAYQGSFTHRRAVNSPKTDCFFIDFGQTGSEDCS